MPTSDELKLELQKAVEKDTVDDGGREAADAQLRRILSDIGVNSGHYGDTQMGRLAQIRSELGRLTEQLERAAREREELAGLAVEQASAQARHEQLIDQIAALTQERLRRRASELAHAVDQARELQRSSAEGETPTPSLAEELPGRVAAANERLERCKSAVPSAEAKAAEVDLASLTGEQDRIARIVDSLASYQSVDTAAESAVRQALSAALSPSEHNIPQPREPAPRDPLLRRFRDEYKLQDRSSSRKSERGRSVALTSAAFVAVAAIALGVLITPVLFALFAVSAVLVFVSAEAGKSPARAQESFEGHRIEDLAARVQDEDRAWAEYDGELAAYRKGIETAETCAAEQRRLLSELLQPVLAGDGDPLGRAEAYLKNCDKHREWVQAVADLTKAKLKLQEARKPIEALNAVEKQLSDAEDELRDLLKSAEIDEADLQVGIERFGELVKADLAARTAAQIRAGATAKLEQLLAGRTIEELERQAEEAQAELNNYEQRNGCLSGRLLKYVDGLGQAAS